MKMQKKNDAFVCDNCDFKNEPTTTPPYRNHCMKCLFSKHVDLDAPGDRKNECEGLLRPVMIENDHKKGEMIVFECITCGFKGRNRIAVDDDIEARAKVAEDYFLDIL